MDTSIARSGRPLDIYGALMRGYQGAMVRQQDQQQQEDRAALLAASGMSQDDPRRLGILSRLNPQGLQAEQNQAKIDNEMRSVAGNELYQFAGMLSQIPEPMRQETLSGFYKTLASSNPMAAKMLMEQFTDTSDDGLRNVLMANIANVPQQDSSYSLNTIRLQAPDGTIRLGQTNNRSPGVTLLPPTVDESGKPLNPMADQQWLNAGNAFIPVPSAAAGGTVLPNVPVNLSPSQQPSVIAEQTVAKEATEAAIAASTKAYEQIASVSKSIANYDDAIKAIDSGAATDKISDMFPSLKVASIELDNVRGRMGLDVVGATTFGSLSESELAFALDTAMPKLPPPEMKKWLERKKAAQIKLRDQLMDAAAFLGTGRTIPEYLQYLSNKGQFSRGKSAAPPVEDTLPVVEGFK